MEIAERNAFRAKSIAVSTEPEHATLDQSEIGMRSTFEARRNGGQETWKARWNGVESALDPGGFPW